MRIDKQRYLSRVLATAAAACIALITLANATAAEVEVVKAGKEFKPGSLAFEYLGTDLTKLRLIQSAIIKDGELRLYCGEKYQLISAKGIAYTSDVIIHPGDEYPRAGSWLIQFVIRRCGVTKHYNTFFFKWPDQEPSMLPWLPGVTPLDNDMYNEISEELDHKARLEAQKPNCNDIKVMNTEFGDRKRYPNRVEIIEYWLLDVCGRLVKLAVDIEAQRGASKLKLGVRRQTEAMRWFGRRGDSTWQRNPHRPLSAEHPAPDELRFAHDQAEKGTDPAHEQFLLKSALNDDSYAQYLLGGLLLKRARDTDLDFDNAMYWIMRSANNGFVPAIGTVGTLFETGMWVPRDLQAAARWHRMAANAGDERSAAALKSLQQLDVPGISKEPVEQMRDQPKSQGSFDDENVDTSP